MALEPWCAAPNAILPYTPAIQASLRPPGSPGSHGPFKNVLLSLLARVRRVWVRARARVMRTTAMMDMSFIFVFMAVASRVRGLVRAKVEWVWEGERSWAWAMWARVGSMTTTALTSH